MNRPGHWRLPAEWEPHRSTILCWPHRKEDWPGKFTPIPWVYAEIVRHLVGSELVRIIVQSAGHRARVERYLKRAHIDRGQVEFILLETDRGWMRDTAPAFVKYGQRTAAVQFAFNGWAKYPNWQKDRRIPGRLTEVTDSEWIEAVWTGRKVVLEGGAIDGNGAGTLVTTEECLLDPEVQVRNPGFTKRDYESLFNAYLGVTNVLWLGRGIAGDDTHGHVDDLCRFVSRDTVVLCREENPDDANYKPLTENFERMADARLEDGSPIDVVPLPMPRPIYFEGLRLPASYANFYIANRAVLVPTFNDPNDRVALNTLKDLFPDRDIVGIHAVDLVWGLGTIHCLSHEEPL
jgi:agmatine deiminase